VERVELEGKLQPYGVSMRCFEIVLTAAVCLSVTAGVLAADGESPVRIEFEKNSERIDIVTGKKLPDYRLAVRGSFRFFSGRLDEPEDYLIYCFEAPRKMPVERIRSMEKFQPSHSLWRLEIAGRADSPQLISRVYSLAVSFVPLNGETKKPGRRVYVLLDELRLIDWENEAE